MASYATLPSTFKKGERLSVLFNDKWYDASVDDINHLGLNVRYNKYETEWIQTSEIEDRVRRIELNNTTSSSSSSSTSPSSSSSSTSSPPSRVSKRKAKVTTKKNPKKTKSSPKDTSGIEGCIKIKIKEEPETKLQQKPETRLFHINTFHQKMPGPGGWTCNRMFAEFLMNSWIAIGTEVNCRKLITSTHNKSPSDIKDILKGSIFSREWGSGDGQTSSYLSMHPQEVIKNENGNDDIDMQNNFEGADIVMMRLPSACERCPVSQQMIPSLFHEGRFKKMHHKGVYVIGKVVTLPSPDMYNHPKSDIFEKGYIDKKWGAAWVQVQWLKMGYMHEISNYNYVKTFTQVKKEEFKQEVLKFAVHDLPDVVKVSDWDSVLDRITP